MSDSTPINNAGRREPPSGTQTAAGATPIREERCERTDLFPSDCAHCRGHDNMRIVRPRTLSGTGTERLLGRWFQAAFDGKCSRCSRPFHAFDMIRADWPEGSGYISQKCHPRARAIVDNEAA